MAAALIGSEDGKRKPRWKDRMPTAQSGAAPARVPQASVGSMPRSRIQDLADNRVLYLTTIGRRTGLPREIEIWFVVHGDRLYLFAETGEAAAWVKNIRRNPGVLVRIGESIGATARVLDREIDRELWDQVTAIAERKYGWGDGLPVEITPSAPCAAYSDKPAGRAP